MTKQCIAFSKQVMKETNMAAMEILTEQSSYHMSSANVICYELLVHKIFALTLVALRKQV